jgi:hypothetical protein
VSGERRDETREGSVESSSRRDECIEGSSNPAMGDADAHATGRQAQTAISHCSMPRTETDHVALEAVVLAQVEPRVGALGVLRRRHADANGLRFEVR